MSRIEVIVTVVVFVIRLTEAGPRCFDCTRLPLPRDCDHITRCGNEEVCFTKQLVSDSGHIYYDTGCLDRLRCPAQERTSGVKAPGDVFDETGDIVSCLDCCHGDFCNSQGCGSEPLPPKPTLRGPICLNCIKGTSTPENCDKVTVCGRNQQCFIENYYNGADSLYRTRCESCSNVENVLVGKRSADTCSRCCSDDFCNQDCSGESHAATVTDIAPSSSKTPTLAPTKPTTSTTTKMTTSTSSTTSSTSTTTVSTTLSTRTTETTTTSPVIAKEVLCLLYGYDFLPDFHYCVKPYTDLYLSWQQARDRCIQEGGDLIVFHNKQEENYFDKWLKNITVTELLYLRYWVGATDLEKEGEWMWVDNTPINIPRYFFPEEPNDAGHDMGFHENCAASIYHPVTNNVLLQDINCTTPSNFICEINLLATSTTHPTTTPRAHCRNSDYVYDNSHGVCYKVYNNVLKTWSEARATCQTEYGDLLQLRNRSTENLFIGLAQQMHHQGESYWLGGTRSDNGHFYWLNGKFVSSSVYRWGPGEPNNVNHNENCLDLTSYSNSYIAINDRACDSPANFICEERCPDTSYTYVPGKDLCFKLHDTQSNWFDARDTCQSEQASLAEPHTLDTVKFFDQYLRTLNTTTYWVGAAQDVKSPGVFWWQTTWQRVSHDLWHAGEPNAPWETCATLYWYKRADLDNLFRLNDNACTLKFSFICQYIW